MLHEHQGLGRRRLCRPAVTGGNRYRSEVVHRPESERSYDGRNLVAGIRPEDLEDAILAQSSSGAGRRLTAPVTLLEPPGSEIMVHSAIDAPTVDSGDPDALDVTLVQGQPNAVGRFNPRSRVRKGEVVEIGVASENLHFFDPQTRSALTEVSS